MTFPVKLLELGEFRTTWRGFQESSWEIWQPRITWWRRRTGGCLQGPGSFRKGVNKPGEGVVEGEGKEKPGNMAWAGIVGPMPTNWGSGAFAAYQTWPPQLPELQGFLLPLIKEKIYALHSQLWEAFVLQLNWKLLAVINYQSCALCPLWFGCSCSPCLKPWVSGGSLAVGWVSCFPLLLTSILINAPGIPPSPSSLLSYCFGLSARLGDTRQRLLFNPPW